MSIISLSRKQRLSIRESQSRINIWEGSVSSGKTIGSIIRWGQYVGTAPKGDLVMVGKTERTLYRNVLRPMEDLFGSDFAYSRGKGEASMWDRMIHIVGLNDAKSETKLRGFTAAGGYIDEASLSPEAAFRMLLSRLRVKGAKLFGTTNPDSPYHWLKKDFLDRRDVLNMSVFHFTMDDNPFLDPEYVESVKLEYTGLWYKRFVDGLWVAAEGAIYDFFDDALHTIAQPPCEPEARSISIDYGTTNPCVFLMFGEHRTAPVKHWCEKEYYYDSKVHNKQKTDEEYARDLIDFIGNRNIDKIIVDPSAASFKAELRGRGMYQVVDADNDIQNGLRRQATALVKGDYKICRCCTNTIAEYYAYMWDDKAQKKGKDEPKKDHDHGKDAERYRMNDIYGDGTGLQLTQLERALQ